MADLLELSARIIDSGVADEPVNRITQELSEIGDGIALVESFSHSVVLSTGDGLVAFDSSGTATGGRVVEAIRGWSDQPITTVVYTHGHLDHVGGSPAFVADAERQGNGRPSFVAHQAVLDRFERYRKTDAWNKAINLRQFGWITSTDLRIGSDVFGEHFLPDDVAVPDVTYADEHRLVAGGTEIVLRHGRGETDDHTWAWLPARRAIFCGDYLIWNFPNAGNPQKVQRYPYEWAVALREMADLGAELLVPAHGLPIGGSERIRTVLLDVAEVLEDLVERTVVMMNADATLDEIIHTVAVAPETLARPYLRPLYDEPEFVVRNIWRQYGGWWDGNPARLKPPRDAALAEEVARAAGGIEALIGRARDLAGAGRLDVACQLVEWAAQAAPDDSDAHRARAEVYGMRFKSEPSLMAKGIYSSVVKESEAQLT